MSATPVVVAGAPFSVWLSTFWATYSLGGDGVRFNGWPDGGAYYEQDELLLQVFDVMRSELGRWVESRTRRR